jgi:hypothetical protein
MSHHFLIIIFKSFTLICAIFFLQITILDSHILIYAKTLLVNQHIWVVHINLCKNIPNELSCLRHAHYLKAWLIGDDSLNHYKIIKFHHLISYQC